MSDENIEGSGEAETIDPIMVGPPMVSVTVRADV
jgi:hypothetical protein